MCILRTNFHEVLNVYQTYKNNDYIIHLNDRKKRIDEITAAVLTSYDTIYGTERYTEELFRGFA